MTAKRGLSVKALVLGVLVDFVGDLVGVVFLGIVITIMGGSFAPKDDPYVLVLATLVTTLAGWAAARVAGRLYALHGFLVGVLAFSLEQLILPHGKWRSIDTRNAIVGPLVGLLGGFLAAPRTPRVRD